MIHARARRLVPLLAALTALLVAAGCASVTATSELHGLRAQDRVGALNLTGATLTGPGAFQSSCVRPGFTASAAGMASGFCVAAEEGLAPIAGGSQLEDLVASGRQLDPADAGGELTRAGRAYSKAGEVFGPTSGGPAAINEAGQNALEDILGNPATKQGVMRGGNFAGGEIHIAPSGIGAVFDPGGVFQYFGRFPY